MAVTVPTRAATIRETLAYLKSLIPSMATSLDTVVGGIVEVVAEVAQGIYQQVYAVERAIWPSATMDEADLDRHAEARLGPNPRKAATISSATSALRVTGTLAGAAVTAGLTLTDSAGKRYQLTSGATVGVGTADVSIESIDTGVACNLLTGDILQFESPPANINQAATLVADLTGGTDGETNGELLARVQQAIRNPPAGGRASDYRTWAMQVASVADAYVYCPSTSAPTGRSGIGTVDVCPVVTGTGTGRLPSVSLMADIQETLDASRPVTTLGSTVVSPAFTEEDVSVIVVPEVGYEFDWINVGGESVGSWNAATREITMGTDSPTLKAAVDANGTARIFLNGELLVVDSYTEVVGTANDIIRLQTAPTTTPVAFDPIYPGGPLSDPVKAAIQAYMDTLGPARGSAADPEQYWDDTLRPSAIAATLVHRVYSDGTSSGVVGVKDVTVVTPAANVTPTDLGGAGVGICCYGSTSITVVPG